jgi:hypothetical protein
MTCSANGAAPGRWIGVGHGAGADADAARAGREAATAAVDDRAPTLVIVERAGGEELRAMSGADQA